MLTVAVLPWLAECPPVGTWHGTCDDFTLTKVDYLELPQELHQRHEHWCQNAITQIEAMIYNTQIIGNGSLCPLHEIARRVTLALQRRRVNATPGPLSWSWHFDSFASYTHYADYMSLLSCLVIICYEWHWKFCQMLRGLIGKIAVYFSY